VSKSRFNETSGATTVLLSKPQASQYCKILSMFFLFQTYQYTYTYYLQYINTPTRTTFSISIHLHVLPPVYQYTYTYYLQYINTPTHTTSSISIHLHILPPVYQYTYTYYLQYINTPTRTTSSISIHLHVLPPVFCVALCVPLFVLSSFSIWPLCCLSFDLQFRITPLVFSNFPTTLSNIERKFHQLSLHLIDKLLNIYIMYHF
jgi:hypothetical protein